MSTVTNIQENAADILASAKDINNQRAAQEDMAANLAGTDDTVEN